MKKILLDIMIFILLLLLPMITFAEVEPNNEPAQATVLTLNGSDGGSLSEIDDHVDWWKITTTFDGSLVVNTTSSDGLDIDLYMYDQDGITRIASYDIGNGIHEATHFYYLRTGTYYVKANRYSGSGSYSISNTFIPTALDNDNEPNDSSEIAQVLAPNNSSTGHLGYYGNRYTDYYDWWKITITFDGALIVNTTSDITLDIDLYLYDKDGKTQIAGYDTSVGIHEATHRYNLTPGTYYVKAFRYRGYGSYYISNTFIATGLPNDPEPNDSVQISSTLALNDSTTGHLGYYDQGSYDINDWWKITLPSDGNITIRTYSDATMDIDLYLYDVNGTSNIAGYDISTGRSEATHYNGIKAGTYYVRAFRYSGYGSYTISSQFTTARLANDNETNDSLSVAQAISLHTIYTGHLGFFGNGSYDIDDYYTFTIPVAWDTLFVRTDSDSIMDVDLRLYNQSGNQIVSSSATGPTELLIYSPSLSVNPGIYSIRLYRYSGYGSYGLIVTNVRPTFPTMDVREEKQEKIIPQNYSLSQNYPNPFNPTTSFQFQIPVNNYVTIKVYNILGREVATLANGIRQAGRYTITWNASGLPSGVYFYQIRAGNYTEIKKAILMK